VVAVNVLPIIIGAVIVAVVGLVISWFKSGSGWIANRLMGRVRPDHWAIMTGWFGGDPGGRSRYYISLKCAPSRRCKSVRLDADDAYDIINRAFPGIFGRTPVHADDVGMRFEAAAPPDVSDRPIAWVWASGLVEATLVVPHTYSQGQGPLISVLDVARPLVTFVEAVRRGSYKRLFRASQARRRRLDWHVTLSNAITDDKGWLPWAALVFPGQEPRARASQMIPPPPGPGLGQRQLRHLRQATPAQAILKPVLDDLIVQSGYLGSDDALRDALQEARTFEQTLPQSTSTRN
jgi:hypothetical protein